MGYLYRHIRLDTNEPFYIGIGGFCKREKEGSYLRANCKDKKRRNNYWFNITNKTDYLVEIIIDNIPIEEAIKNEIEYIKLYGRKDLGLGTLVNMTDGGEGHKNYVCSSETKRKMSEAAKGDKNSQYGKKKSQETIDRKIKSGNNKKSVSMYSLIGEYISTFESLRSASRGSLVDFSSIHKCVKGIHKTAGGFIWRFNS